MTRRAGPARRVVTAALALVAGACSSSEPVRIGVVVRSEASAAAQVAAAEINASGGINGRLLVLRMMSAGDSTLARPAIAAAESLAQDRSVIAVVGHSYSSASLSASQIYNTRGVVHLSPTSTAPLLTDAGRYTFRLVASDIYQARFIADEVAGSGAIPRTALFFVNDDYGRALHDALRARLAERSVPVVFDQPYVENQAVAYVNGAVRTLADARPAVIVWLGRAQQFLESLPALRRAMLSGRILASDGLDDIATAPNADGMLTGVRWVRFLDLNGGGARLSALRARYLAKTGEPLTVESALTYDAVMLLATAARAARPTRIAIREYLESLGRQRPAFAGATGAVVFDDNGDRRTSYMFFEITRDGAQRVGR